MTKQTVFMTGATGLVGSRFVEMYQNNYKVINIDLATGVDITDLSSIEKIIKANPNAKHLIHLAAFTDTNKAMEQKGDLLGLCYQVNVIGTKNIATLCSKYNIHLIHVSTDFVFDGTKNDPYTEEDPTSPIEWYGQTKAIAEEEVKKIPSSVILRIAYPYRANYDLKPDIISKIRMGLESGSLPPQFVDTTITPTFVDDIAKAFDASIRLGSMGIYHVVGDTSLSPYELAKKVAKAYGFDPTIVKSSKLIDYLKTATRPIARNTALSNAKATHDFGINFANIDTGLSNIINQQKL